VFWIAYLGNDVAPVQTRVSVAVDARLVETRVVLEGRLHGCGPGLCCNEHVDVPSDDVADHLAGYLIVAQVVLEAHVDGEEARKHVCTHEEVFVASQNL
jgi:hypothetical protein